MSKLVSDQVPSRRQFVQMGLAGAAVSLLTGGMELAFPPTAAAQSTLTPEEALAELMAGNKRFISGQLTSFEHDLAILKQHTVDKQEPFATVKLWRVFASRIQSLRGCRSKT